MTVDGVADLLEDGNLIGAERQILGGHGRVVEDQRRVAGFEQQLVRRRERPCGLQQVVRRPEVPSVHAFGRRWPVSREWQMQFCLLIPREVEPVLLEACQVKRALLWRLALSLTAGRLEIGLIESTPPCSCCSRGLARTASCPTTGAP